MNKPEPRTRIDAGWIATIDPDARVLRNHSLVIEKGRILAIEPTEEAVWSHPGATVVDRRGSILMPGLVNSHTHLAMNLLRGFADDLPLMTWLKEHIWPAEAQHVSPEFVRDGTELALAELLLGGVTTVNDMYFHPDQTAAACDQAGLRACVGMIVLDFPSGWAQNSDEYLDKGLALHDALRDHDRLSTAFAPHAPYSVSRQPLERIATLSAELDLPVHMHVHETATEVSEFVATHGVRPLARLHDIGLVNPSLLAVHLTQLVENEIELLGEHGAHALHCPESNLKLASGFSPVARLMDAGANVALGTDGAASNNDLDLFGEMRTAAMLAKAVSDNPAAVPAVDALRMVTINGATALGMADETGSLEVGKAADIVCIEPDISMAPMYDVHSHLAYCTGRDRVSDVWAAGQQLVRNRELLTLDTDSLMHKAHEWAEAIQHGDSSVMESS